MPDKAWIIEVIFEAMYELNQNLLKEQPLSIASDRILFGQNGQLDSIGLVNLIALVEEGIADRFELTIMLTDEKAMSAKNSPFRTADTLADFIMQRLNDHGE